MDEMPVDVDEARPVILTVHQMVFPDLVEERFRHGRFVPSYPDTVIGPQRRGTMTA
jgi:hypothetical protein